MTYTSLGVYYTNSIVILLLKIGTVIIIKLIKKYETLITIVSRLNKERKKLNFFFVRVKKILSGKGGGVSGDCGANGGTADTFKNDGLRVFSSKTFSLTDVWSTNAALVDQSTK